MLVIKADLDFWGKLRNNGGMQQLGDYLGVLKERKRDFRISKKHQLLGVELAELLGDEKRAGFYIKLAKEMNHAALLRLAKDVAERHHVKNKAAYFTKLLKLRRDGQ